MQQTLKYVVSKHCSYFDKLQTKWMERYNRMVSQLKYQRQLSHKGYYESY